MVPRHSVDSFAVKAFGSARWKKKEGEKREAKRMGQRQGLAMRVDKKSSSVFFFFLHINTHARAPRKQRTTEKLSLSTLSFLALSRKTNVARRRRKKQREEKEKHTRAHAKKKREALSLVAPRVPVLLRVPPVDRRRIFRRLRVHELVVVGGLERRGLARDAPFVFATSAALSADGRGPRDGDALLGIARAVCGGGSGLFGAVEWGARGRGRGRGALERGFAGLIGRRHIGESRKKKRKSEELAVERKKKIESASTLVRRQPFNSSKAHSASLFFFFPFSSLSPLFFFRNTLFLFFASLHQQQRAGLPTRPSSSSPPTPPLPLPSGHSPRRVRAD